MASSPLLRLPRNPWLLIAVLLALGVTKSKRAVNLAWSDIILFSADWDAGAMIGSAIFIIYTIPLALIIWATVFRNYPKRPIGLFEHPQQGGFKIVFVHFLCALMIFGNLLFVSSEWKCALGWLRAGDRGGVIGMFGGVVSSFGAILLWLCIRAIVTAKANDRLNQKLYTGLSVEEPRSCGSL